MSASIKFGTDGWRAIIAEDFTFLNVSHCAQGVADYIKSVSSPTRGLIVGYDTRFASDRFAARTAEVFAGNNLPTLLCDRAAPTPVITYHVLAKQTSGAGIITASHNPPEWNGFKFKPDYAGSASSDIIALIESKIAAAQTRAPSTIPLSDALESGLIRLFDPRGHYVDHVAKIVDLDSLKQAGFNICVDAMHGAGAGYLPLILASPHESIAEIRSDANPGFPHMQQPEPIAQNLSALSNHVVDSNSDIGIAFDGDADRLGIIDEHGRYISTLQVFALLALYMLELRGERGPIVKSFTSSNMILKLGKLFKVPVFETGVGFKFASPLMIKENAMMAGEESGGYAFNNHIPERDGILSSLLFLEFMARTGKKPSELLQRLFDLVGEHHFGRRDIEFDLQNRLDIEERLTDNLSVNQIGGMDITEVDSLEGIRFRCNESWVAIRFSGTEPLVRIYAESDDPSRVAALLNGAQELLGI